MLNLEYTGFLIFVTVIEKRYEKKSCTVLENIWTDPFLKAKKKADFFFVKHSILNW